MRQPVNRELFAYWDALRAGRSAPERSAIDPAAIRNLLAYTFLLEIGEADGVARFRLSGTRLNALFRRDLKGGSFSALWAKNEEPEVSALLEGVLGGSTPVVAGVRAGPKDYEQAEFEMLLLPLRHHGRTHARVLGSIAAEAVPSWTGLRPIDGLRLVSFRTVLPREEGRLGTFGRAARSVMEAPPPVRSAPVRTAPLPASGSAVEGRPTPFRVYQGGRSSTGAALTGSPADLA